MNSVNPNFSQNEAPWSELERSVYETLRTYANVHRGSGHASQVTTALFERAREIVLEYTGLSPQAHRVIFCSPYGAEELLRVVQKSRVRVLSSAEIGLPLGVLVLVVPKQDLPQKGPVLVGGGTARLVGPDWVVWAKDPDRFEAGTPAIINIIAFARALQLVGRYGSAAFFAGNGPKYSAHEILGRDDLLSERGDVLLQSLFKTRIGLGQPVPTAQGERPYIHLDHAASTPTFEAVWKTVREAWRLDEQGRGEMLVAARTLCARLMGAPLDLYDIFFVANTTEGINVVARSQGALVRGDEEGVVVNTLLEHNSNELPWRFTPGLSLIRLSVDDEGFIDLIQLERLLADYNERCVYGKKRIRLVTISSASNVLGTCNDIAAIASIVHRYGARILVDAAQLVAHRSIDAEAWHLDYLVLSGHKVYAPFGSGVLLVRKGLLGLSEADQSHLRRLGEENIGGIAALGKALSLMQRIGYEVISSRELALTEYLLRGLRTIPGIRLYGVKEPDSVSGKMRTGVVSFDFKTILAARIARELAERGGVGIRYGCHCAHLLVKHILHIPAWGERIQQWMVLLITRIKLPGVARISLGLENNERDVDEVLSILREIVDKKPYSPVEKQTVRRQIEALVQEALKRVYP